jgi:hypothetical protein
MHTSRALIRLRNTASGAFGVSVMGALDIVGDAEKTVEAK